MKTFIYKTEEEVIDAAMHIMESKMSASESYTNTASTCNIFSYG